MVTCAASGCKNTSVKGVTMCNFPKDINRRQIWQKNANLENKPLCRSTALCEFHFTSNMWEKIRADGRKKLKNTAVPTIFGELVTQKTNRKTAVNKDTASINTSLSTNFSTITSSTTDSHDIIITIDESQENPKEKKYQSNHSTSNTNKETAQLSIDGNCIQNNQSISLEEECDLEVQISLSEKIKKLEKMFQKSEWQRLKMKKNHKRLHSNNIKKYVVTLRRKTY